MNKLRATALTGAIVLAFSIAISLSVPSTTYAEKSNDQPAAPLNQSDKKEEMYNYTAQPGDSYSKLARKALQTYGINNNANIGGTGILFAETNITAQAGWPALDQGQKVQIAKTTVKEWFDKAAKLSAEEKAGWSYYLPYVDFNTNAIGESTNS